MGYDLSIIVPIYNTQKYLKSFLDSLTQQNVNSEVILINDGSTDNSLNIIKKYCEKYSNWRYINNKINKGSNKSRNIGLKEASGKYIIFCDSDDLIPPHIFEKMIYTLKKYNGDIITGQVRKFSDNPPQNINYKFKNNVYVWEDDINKFIFKKFNKELITNINDSPSLICNLTVWNKIYKKELLLNHYFDETEGYKSTEGGIYCIPLLFNSNKIIVLNEPVYYWRYNEDSLSVQEGFSKDKLNYIFDELELINNYDRRIGDTYFEMIKEVIIPAFLGENSNYY